MQQNKTSWRIHIRVWLSLAVCCTSFVWPQTSAVKPASSLAAARAKVSRGELESAERTLWSVLSGDPNQSEALTLLGVIRGRQKRYPEAEALLRRALQLDPQSLPAHRNLASALIAEDKTDAAIAEYKEIIGLSPADDVAKVDLARLYLTAGQFSDALSALDSIPAHRLPADAVPAKAASLLGLGKKQEASTLIARAKQSPTMAAELAEVFLDGNAPEYALKTVDAVLTGSQRAPARLYYLKGRALRATGNTAGALNSLRAALARDPKSADTLVAMAAIHASKRDHAESLGLLKRAYVLHPDSVAVLRPLVVEGIEAGERNTALRAAHALAEKSPDNLDDLYLAAAAMLEGREFATASSIFEKYVSQRPADSKGFLGLGIAQLAQQHYAEAKKAFQQALQINPNFADAEYQLGVVADRQGVAAEALQHFDHAVQLQPQHAKALAGLGGQYLQSGDLDKAHWFLARSLAADPNNYKAEYDLALVLAKLGQTAEAKQHMERSRVLKAAEDMGKNPASVAAKP